MVNVSKKYINKELQMSAWGVFLHKTKEANSSEEVLTNLKKFLTSSEITMLEKRLLIPLLIERGLSYRDIGRALDVSSTTISFVKHNLIKRATIHRKYNFGKKQEKKKPFLPRYKGVAPLFQITQFRLLNRSIFVFVTGNAFRQCGNMLGALVN